MRNGHCVCPAILYPYNIRWDLHTQSKSTENRPKKKKKKLATSVRERPLPLPPVSELSRLIRWATITSAKNWKLTKWKQVEATERKIRDANKCTRPDESHSGEMLAIAGAHMRSHRQCLELLQHHQLPLTQSMYGHGRRIRTCGERANKMHASFIYLFLLSTIHPSTMVTMPSAHIHTATHYVFRIRFDSIRFLLYLIFLIHIVFGLSAEARATAPTTTEPEHIDLIRSDYAAWIHVKTHVLPIHFK